MNRHSLIFMLMAAIIAVACPAVSSAEDLEGKYHIQGWDPGHTPEGDPDYEGTARLTSWGQTWRYHGIMDEMTYAGAGIHAPENGTLSLSFINGDGSERGVTLLRITDTGFTGVWAMDNGGNGTLGHEIWTKIK